MKYCMPAFVMVCLVLAQGPASGAEQRIKGLKDPDFLLLLKNSPTQSETVIGGITGKFYTVTPPEKCGDAQNPVVGYIYFSDPGDCAPEQLIRLPLSVTWKLVNWSGKGKANIMAQLVREYQEKKVLVREEWEITGNGRQYRITKQQL